MRHRVKGRKLSRTSSHRKATLRSLATSLLKYKKIRTTIAKAKELRVFVEPLITKAKIDSVASRRYVADYIKDKEVVKELFSEVIPKIGDRPGGYTRVVKLGQRKGDAAELAFIELVDYSGIVKPKTPKKEKAEIKQPKEKIEEVKEEPVEKKKEPKTKAKPKEKPKAKTTKTKQTEEKPGKEKEPSTKSKSKTTKKTGNKDK